MKNRKRNHPPPFMSRFLSFFLTIIGQSCSFLFFSRLAVLSYTVDYYTITHAVLHCISRGHLSLSFSSLVGRLRLDLRRHLGESR